MCALANTNDGYTQPIASNHVMLGSPCAGSTCPLALAGRACSHAQAGTQADVILQHVMHESEDVQGLCDSHDCVNEGMLAIARHPSVCHTCIHLVACLARN